MAEATVKDQDQYNCSICLDLMKNPVTIPCGHSYCMVCIGDYWDSETLKRINCPQCRQNFVQRPALNKNTMLAEIMENLTLKTSDLNSKAAPPTQKTADPEDIECDFCSGNGVKAVKSCLECRASYCETHIQPHYDIPALKRHKLVNPTNLPTCPKHDKLLEVFCRTDQKCICMMCLMDDHKLHDTVSCSVEREEKQVEVKTVKSKFEEKCKEKEKKLCELQNNIGSHVNSALQAVKDTENAFKESITFIEKRCSEIIDRIRAQEKANLERLGDVREELELEIAKLRTQGDVLDRFLETGDNVYFLQNYDKIPSPPGDEDCSSQSLVLVDSFENVSKTVSDFKEKLEVFCKQEADNILNTVSGLSSKTNSDLDSDFHINIGDQVCVKPSVKTPRFNWGAHVTHKSIGVVKAINGETVIVNFAEHKNWKGALSEMKLVSVATDQEASATNSSIKVGDQVRVKPSVDTPKHKWGGITHQSVGIVKSLDGEALTVDFPEYSSWRGIVPEMEVAPADNVSVTNCSFSVGNKVRVKLSVVTPKHQWGGVTHRSVGTVTAINADVVTVDFPECKCWKGIVSEMELVSSKDIKACFKTGDRVRVKASVIAPKRGWGSATNKSVGVVTALNGEIMTVDFPEHKSWKGTISEMELVPSADSESYNFKCGDQVRVKASVKTPKYNWGSISHKSVGTVKALKLVVDFPEQSNWSGDPSEMELVP